MASFLDLKNYPFLRVPDLWWQSFCGPSLASFPALFIKQEKQNGKEKGYLKKKKKRKHNYVFWKPRGFVRCSFPSHFLPIKGAQRTVKTCMLAESLFPSGQKVQKHNSLTIVACLFTLVQTVLRPLNHFAPSSDTIVQNRQTLTALDQQWTKSSSTLWCFTVQVKEQLGTSPGIFSALLGSMCQIFGLSHKLWLQCQATGTEASTISHILVCNTDAFVLKIFSAMTMSYCFTTRQWNLYKRRCCTESSSLSKTHTF